MNEGKISIIITTYNRRNYLEKAINSVLNQTYKNIEIIVIDDCSKDDTKEYMEKINNPSIKFYSNEKNQGCGKNRKEALEKYASGDYIIFLDDDDLFIDNNYFFAAIELFNKDKMLSMVCANHVVYDTMNKIKTEKKFPYGQKVDNKQFFLNFSSKDYPKPIISIAIIKKEALEFAHYQEMDILNDTTIFLRSLLYGPMGFINKTMAQYLVHGNNISFNCDVDFIIQNLEEKYKVYKMIPNEFQLNSQEKLQWLEKQCDITIVYFIKGSKPSFFQFKKLLRWVKQRIKNKDFIKTYNKVYKETKKDQKSI